MLNSVRISDHMVRPWHWGVLLKIVLIVFLFINIPNLIVDERYFSTVIVIAIFIYWLYDLFKFIKKPKIFINSSININNGREYTGFEKMVVDAIDTLPQDILNKIKNVDIIVEDYPTEEDLKRLKLSDNQILFGLYRGTPLTHRSVWHSGGLPDKITIFQKNIERLQDPEKIKNQVIRTVLHEIGHYFGIDERKIREIGL